MTEVLLGVGSNIDRERYITLGLDALADLLGELRLSPVYDSVAIGFEGQPFLNLVVQAYTELPLRDLATRLRAIEKAHGRPENATRFSSRHLDIDILTFGELSGDHQGVVLPRPEILENAFVLRPLADLVPESRHPVDGRTYAALWRAYDQTSQALERVRFSWRGSVFS